MPQIVINNEMSNNSSNNSSLTQVEYICNNYFIPTVCGFGMVCNVLNLAVLSRRQMKESPYSYLMGLSVADFTVLTLSFIQSVFSNKYGENIYAWKFYDAYIFYPFANVFANASVWITVMLTVERWVSVRFPLQAKDVCTRSLARKAMLGVFVISLIVNIPRFLGPVIEKDTDGTYIVNRSKFEESNFYVGVTWFYVCTVHVIPCVLLVTLNICLICLVYRANQRRNILQESYHHGDDHQSNKEQTRLTITCISIIFLFLICIIPSAFSNRPVAFALFSKNMVLRQFLRQPFYRVLRVVTNMLVFCNLSLNFVLYCVFNNKFMRTLHMLLRYWLKMLLRSGNQRQRRMSRRSSTSSACYSTRGNGVYGFKRSLDAGSAHYTPCQAMYFHIEAYPLSRGSYQVPMPGTSGRNKRQRFELSSQTEISDTM